MILYIIPEGKIAVVVYQGSEGPSHHIHPIGLEMLHAETLSLSGHSVEENYLLEMKCLVKVTVPKKLSLPVLSSIFTVNSSSGGPFSNRSASTIWTLHLHSCNWLWRTFCTVEQEICSSLLVQWMDFLGLHQNVSQTISTASACTEGLLALF